jgi:alkylation response protein AidB-like acyl-CoA dehydrogenase
MTNRDDGLNPEEFASAAIAPIDAAIGCPPREAARVLAEAGLSGVCACESDGGLGLDIAFAIPIAHASGRRQLRLPLIEQIVLAKALDGTGLATTLVSGEKLAGIALRGDTLSGHAAHARCADMCDWILVPDGEQGAVLVEVDAERHRADRALDPDYPQFWTDLSGARVLARLERDTYATLRRDLNVLIAAFVNGAADSALERTADYLSTRVQFGRPLSAKQAVRHLLARMKLAQEAAAASIRRAIGTDEYDVVRDERPALACALTNAAFVIEKAIHLHGGMGFTWEVPLHVSLRDVRKFDAALDPCALQASIGRDTIQAM